MHYNKMFKLIICTISTLFLVACASKEITQTKAETTVELGSECTIIPTDYFELGSKVNPDTITVDISAVDTNAVGEYVAVVTYNDNIYEIKVSVSDTIAPEITVKPDIEGVDRGTTIYPANYVSVNDLSEVSVYFVTEDGDNESLEIPSDLDNDVTEINYTVVAVDAEGNRSEELSVTVPIFTFKQGEIEGEALPLEPIEPIEPIEEEPTQLDEGNLQIDALGVDGTTEEDEYDETRDNIDTESEKSVEERTDEAIEAVLQELRGQFGEEVSGHLEGNPLPEGYLTPSTGEVFQESNFDPSVQAPAGRLE